MNQEAARLPMGESGSCRFYRLTKGGHLLYNHYNKDERW